MAYIIYVIDTETTGLDQKQNDVIEVSFWRLSDNEQKTWQIKAVNPETISEKALKINGHKIEDILHKTAFGKETYLEPADVVSEIEVWMLTDGATVNDRVFVGQNPDFDYGFLKELWDRTGNKDTFPFGRFVIDTISLVKFIDLCTGKRRERYNLGSLIKDFKITKQKAHRASEDVKMTKDLFNKIFEPIKEHIATTFNDAYG